MNYTKKYVFSHDIDWYCIKNNVWIHACTRGGLLPGFADEQEQLRRLQSLMSNLPEIVDRNDVLVNEDFIEERYDRTIRIYNELQDGGQLNNDVEDYVNSLNPTSFRDTFAESFVEMAMRGLYSFARIDIDNPLDSNYKLIARPRNNVFLNVQRNLRNFQIDREMERYLRSITHPGANDDFNWEDNYVF